MKVLAGDIGGTKTWLQIADVSAAGCRVLAEERYPSAAWDGLLPMVQAFLAALPDGEPPPAAACFGIAGPVHEGSARTTNLPWTVDAAAIAAATGIARVRLLNDFEIIGYGIEALGEDDVVVLQPGTDRPRAPRAVIGAGTGLGEALLHWAGDHYAAHASEGGHADFAPIDDLQDELLRWLRARHPHVSWERVVSGPGLENIHAFLRETNRAPESEALRAAIAAEGVPAAVTRFAQASADPLAMIALDIFARAFGAQAGNLALTGLTTGGVWVAGGIAPRIADKLADGSFVAAFLAKGRMRAVLESIPVRLITNPRVGLIGAAIVADRQAREAAGVRRSPGSAPRRRVKREGGGSAGRASERGPTASKIAPRERGSVGLSPSPGKRGEGAAKASSRKRADGVRGRGRHTNNPGR